MGGEIKIVGSDSRPLKCRPLECRSPVIGWRDPKSVTQGADAQIVDTQKFRLQHANPKSLAESVGLQSVDPQSVDPKKII